MKYIVEVFKFYMRNIFDLNTKTYIYSILVVYCKYIYMIKINLNEFICKKIYNRHHRLHQMYATKKKLV